MRVFIDSDVIISSLLSSKGAAFKLLHEKDIIPIVSTASLKELRVVCKRLHIANDALETLIQKKCTVIPLQIKTQNRYKKYVLDPNDLHVVAGATSAKALFLISYNLKHFRVENIKNDLKILCMTPALFLQYLRSN